MFGNEPSLFAKHWRWNIYVINDHEVPFPWRPGVFFAPGRRWALVSSLLCSRPVCSSRYDLDIPYISASTHVATCLCCLWAGILELNSAPTSSLRLLSNDRRHASTIKGGDRRRTSVRHLYLIATWRRKIRMTVIRLVGHIEGMAVVVIINSIMLRLRLSWLKWNMCRSVRVLRSH